MIKESVPDVIKTEIVMRLIRIIGINKTPDHTFGKIYIEKLYSSRSASL